MKKFFLSIIALSFVLISYAQTIEKVEEYYYLVSPNAELRSMIESDNATISYISENGEWACGSAFNNADGVGFQVNASKWNLSTGERTYLITEDEIDAEPSDAFCISNDGTLVGGEYLSQPAYNLNGEWHTLTLPNRYTMGEVKDLAIVGTDTIFVGRVFDGDGFQKVQAVKWVNNVLITATELIPEDFLYDEYGKMMNQITGISTDGKVMLGAIKPLNWPTDPNIEERVPFIIKDGEFKLLSPMNREEFSKFDKNSVCFFQGEKLSHNGKFIALHLLVNQMDLSCYYDIEQDKFIIIEEAPENTTCLVVDNDGNPYYGGPVRTDSRSTYVSINGKVTLIDDVLKNNFGITQEQIDATCPDDDRLKGNLRWIYDISSDAKTIIGCAGLGRGTYNWVLKLKKSLYDLDSEDLDSIPNEGEDITEGEVYGLYVASENPEMGGVKIILVAEAIEGFEFVEWSDGNTFNPRIIELTEDTELYARFKIVGEITNVATSKISVAEVYSRDGVLYVEGAESDYHVLDMAGRLIYSGRQSALSLPRGVYLVTIAGEVEKVVL